MHSRGLHFSYLLALFFLLKLHKHKTLPICPLLMHKCFQTVKVSGPQQRVIFSPTMAYVAIPGDTSGHHNCAGITSMLLIQDRKPAKHPTRHRIAFWNFTSRIVNFPTLNDTRAVDRKCPRLSQMSPNASSGKVGQSLLNFLNLFHFKLSKTLHVSSVCFM